MAELTDEEVDREYAGCLDMALWTYISSLRAQLEEEKGKREAAEADREVFREALNELISNLPRNAIFDAQEIWGVTNTRIVEEAIDKANKLPSTPSPGASIIDALKFYADENNHIIPKDYIASIVESDGGAKARAALKEGE